MGKKADFFQKREIQKIERKIYRICLSAIIWED